MKWGPLAFVSFKSFRGLFSGRGDARQLIGSILGMSLGLVPLIVVLVVADGMISGITDRYVETFTYHLQAYPMGGGSRADLSKEAEALRQVPGITAVWQERSGFGLGYSADRRLGLQLRGLEPEALTNDPGFKRFLRYTEGGPDFAGPDGVLVGTEVARQLGLKVGSPLKILTARPGAGGSLLPRISTFTVRGIFTSGYQDLDKLWAILPFEAARKLLAGVEYTTALGIKTTDAYHEAERLLPAVRDALPVGFRVYTWQDLGQAQYKNFETTRVLLLFTMFMIVLVSAVNIMSAMMMIVHEKQKDIGILKALGASPGNISRIFTLMGAFSGLIGSALGTGLGLLAAVNVNNLIGVLDSALNAVSGLVHNLSGAPGPAETIKILNSAYYLEQIPVKLDLMTIFSFSLLAVLLATLAAWVPAQKAARLRPLEVLRKF